MQKLAISVCYNGLAFNGLERAKTGTTVESCLLSAMARAIQTAKSHRVAFVNISRAHISDTGESAAVQVISLEIDSEDAAFLLGNLDKVRAFLPAEMELVSAKKVDIDFSARRNLELKTIEFYIPTYVFSKPHDGVMYYSEYKEEPVPELLHPPASEEDGIVTSLRRTLSRKLTQRKVKAQVSSESLKSPVYPVDKDQDKKEVQQEDILNILAQEVTRTPPNTAVTPVEGAAIAPEVVPVAAVAAEEKLNVKEPEKKKEKKKTSFLRRLVNLIKKKKKQQKTAAMPTIDTAVAEPPKEESIYTTLKRSLSRKGTLSRPKETYMGIEYEPIEDADNKFEPEYYEVLSIPEPSDERKQLLRDFRLSLQQLETFKHCIEMYKGTHNFHNYLNTQHSDSKSYMRISDIAVIGAPFVSKNGMEWIRVSITSNSITKAVARKIVSLCALVTRTNTPRAVVANSFSFAKMDIPEVPPFLTVLTSLVYSSEEAIAEKREGFNEELVEKLLKFEHDIMSYEVWMRQLDSTSFLYKYFLNERGVIGQRNAFVKQV